MKQAPRNITAGIAMIVVTVLYVPIFFYMSLLSHLAALPCLPPNDCTSRGGAHEFELATLGVVLAVIAGWVLHVFRLSKTGLAILSVPLVVIAVSIGWSFWGR
jgi:hypothetical protein